MHTQDLEDEDVGTKVFKILQSSYFKVLNTRFNGACIFEMFDIWVSKKWFIVQPEPGTCHIYCPPGFGIPFACTLSLTSLIAPRLYGADCNMIESDQFPGCKADW